MPDYQNGKIYKVVCDETNLTYYGSTVQPLSKRLHQHKNNRNLCMTKNMKNMKIFLVETFPCNTKEELHSRERFYVEQNPCCNKKIPLRTQKEYKDQNKDKIKEINKEYREANKEKRKKYDKEYRDQNKYKIKEYRDANKDKLKEYYNEYWEANKEKLKEKMKEYTKEYKKTNKEKLKEKITCECGSVVRKSDKARHLKSQKHIDYISNLS